MTRALTLAAAGAALFLQACTLGQGRCENRPLDAQPSPDGALVAFVFSRECGATTGRSVQVSVLPATETTTAGGNALIMDKAGDYDASLAPQWQADGSLVLTIPTGARVFRQETSVGEVPISYRGRP